MEKIWPPAMAMTKPPKLNSLDRKARVEAAGGARMLRLQAELHVDLEAQAGADPQGSMNPNNVVFVKTASFHDRASIDSAISISDLFKAIHTRWIICQRTQKKSRN